VSNFDQTIVCAACSLTFTGGLRYPDRSDATRHYSAWWRCAFSVSSSRLAASNRRPLHPISVGYLYKWINMDDQDLKLIRQIVASDARKYTAGNIDRSRYDRLVDMGWLTPIKTNVSDVEYQVTEKGRTASVASRRSPCL
jgi:hypothetical protein